MYYFEGQPSDDGRLIWRRMGHDADREDGVIMLQLPAGNASRYATNGSTAAEAMARANESDEQQDGREQCELDEDDYSILTSPADDFVLIADTMPQGSET